MNIQEIKEKVLELTNHENHIRLPYSLMVSAIETTKENANLDVYELDFSTVFFFRVINGVKAVLEHLEIEFDYPLLEDGEIDAYATYDQFAEIFEILEYNTLFKYNELLDAEIDLVVRERISLGMFESRIISIAEKLTESVSKISEVATDKKKLGGLIKEVKKQMPELGNLLKDVKVEK